MHKVGQYYGLETTLDLDGTYVDGAPRKSAALQVKARLPREDGQDGDAPLLTVPVGPGEGGREKMNVNHALRQDKYPCPFIASRLPALDTPAAQTFPSLFWTA